MAQKDTSENEKTYRQKYRRALADLISCRPVAYYPRLAKAVGGVKCAVLLSQLLYWNGDESVTKEKDGWFFKSVDELEAETGLEKWEQATARKELTDRGLIESVLKGWPRKWFYRVASFEKLGEALIGDVSLPTGNVANGKRSQHETQPTQTVANRKHSQRKSQPTGNALNGKPSQHLSRNVTNVGDESSPTTEAHNNVLNTEITPEITAETTESLSSSSSNPVVSKNAPAAAAATGLENENLAVLNRVGIKGKTANELSKLSWMTPEYIQDHADLAADQGKPIAILITRLRCGDQLPQEQEDQDAEARERAERAKYVTGELAAFINH